MAGEYLVLRLCCERFDGSNEQFAELIREALEDMAISQQVLADEFQVAASTVSRWSRGVARPHPKLQKLIIDRIKKLAKEAEK